MAMIPPGLATPEDVARWLGRALSEPERNLAAVLVDGAARKIMARIPDLAAKLTAGALDIETVIMVQANAVCRVLRNPDGYRSEAAGTFSYQVDSRVAAGFLAILPEEWRDLGVEVSTQLAPATDAYANARRAADPSLWFQTGWPARDQVAEYWGWGW
ncbi:Gp19/Gp15/Gp42 family protein [Nocardia brasiliensis]|uniref:Gp19/Gp15/Gp42 family protein n=1 Tax=Nocardia brasiliensis TaxID=37326 RepID=UPI002454F91C|nr:Gp19/Gp15/Gp42 family protein [Nocardia brasiliensis]